MERDREQLGKDKNYASDFSPFGTVEYAVEYNQTWEVNDMKMEKIVEVGVATKNLESTSKKYVDILGATPSEMLPVDQYGNLCQMCRIADVDLRLMEPTVDNDTARLIEKRRGDCLSYIGFRVPDIRRAIAWLKRNNAKMIDETPKVEDGVRFAFVHPDSFRNMLFKLIEGQHKHRYLPKPSSHAAIPAPARVKRLYHIGVNVTDLDAATQLYTEVLGTRPSAVQTVEMYDMKCTMNRIGDIEFELLAATREDGVIGKSIARLGEGMVHLAFLVPDIESTIAWLMKSQIRMIDETPKEPGIEPFREAFTHPAGFNGVMYEFIQGEHTLFEQ